MRHQIKLLSAAGLALSMVAAASAILTGESSVEASSLPRSTMGDIIRASGSDRTLVREVRAVRPGKFTTDACKKATWPYIPEGCLTRGKPVDMHLLK